MWRLFICKNLTNYFLKLKNKGKKDYGRKGYITNLKGTEGETFNSGMRRHGDTLISVFLINYEQEWEIVTILSVSLFGKMWYY